MTPESGAEPLPTSPEAVAPLLPGYQGYASRLHWRQSDRLVRDSVKRALDGAGRELARAVTGGDPALTEEVSRASFRIRYAREQAEALTLPPEASHEAAPGTPSEAPGLEEADRRTLAAADAVVGAAVSLGSLAMDERVGAARVAAGLADVVVERLRQRLEWYERMNAPIRPTEETSPGPRLGNDTPWPPLTGSGLTIGGRHASVRSVCTFVAAHESWVAARLQFAEGPAQLEEWPGAGRGWLALLFPVNPRIAVPPPYAVVWEGEHYHRTTEGTAQVSLGAGPPGPDEVSYWRFEAFSGRKLRLERNPGGGVALFGELIPAASIGAAPEPSG